MTIVSMSVTYFGFIDNVTNDTTCLQKSPKLQTVPSTKCTLVYDKEPYKYFEISAKKLLNWFIKGTNITS